MPLAIMPPSRNASAKALVEVFMRAEKKLIAEITRKRAKGYVDYAEVARLKAIREILQEMVDDSAKYIPSAIEYEFYKGAKHEAGYKNAAAVATAERGLAIEQLEDNLLGQVQEMAGTAYQSAVSKLALLGRTESDIFREVGLTQAIESMAVGRGAMTTTEEVIRNLNEVGITAFVDKAGREWSLRSYGNMAVRTTVRQAQVSALLTEDDHDLYQVVWHYAPCRLCATYAGRVYSKSGKNPHYPPLAMAFGKIDLAGPNDLANTFLNIHPNCLCSLTRYTEAGKTEQQIERMRERSSFEKHPADIDPRSKREIEAYRTKERNRARLLAEQKQWMRYKEAGVPGVPQTFQTFQKHKRLDDEKYREWLKEYRKVEKPKIEKPKTPVKKEYRPPHEQEILKQFKTYDPDTRTAREKLSQVNPHYYDGRSYQINCQRCVVAHELVWRGYDVEALPRANDAIGSSGVKMWKFKNPALWSKDENVRVAEKRSQLKGMIKNAFDEWGNGARAIFRIKWKNSNSAHFISIRRDGDEIIFSDPQSNKFRIDYDTFIKRVSIGKYQNWFMRVDDRELNDLVTLAVKNRE
jgi:hypothetical protein